MKSAFPALIALAVMALPSASLSGQDTEWNRYTLEELAGVHVRAEAGSECQAAGVSAETVRSEAEAALTEAEIPVLSEVAMLEAPGLPELRVSVGCAERSGSVGFALSLRVQQAAQMIRDPQITLPEAVTWFADAVGVVDEDDVESAVRETLSEKIQEFAAAFAAANPVEEEVSN